MSLESKNKQESIQEKEEIQEDKENNKLQEKLELYEDQLKRAQAEFANYKKRIAKDIENVVLLEISKILNEFFIFKQTLEKAIINENNEDSKNNLTELDNNLENILTRLNIKKIDIKNKEFDYNISECVSNQNVKDNKLNNKVIDIIEEGYTYKNKLIKPAKVIVGKLEE